MRPWLRRASPGLETLEAPGEGQCVPLVLGVFSQVNALRRQLRLLTALNLELGEARGEREGDRLGPCGGSRGGSRCTRLYAIGFAFAAAAAGLAEALPLWLSLLIVAGVILLVAGILGFLAMRFARRASPPQPSEAIQEAEWTPGRCAEMAELSTDEIRQEMAVERHASTRRATACELSCARSSQSRSSPLRSSGSSQPGWASGPESGWFASSAKDPALAWICRLETSSGTVLEFTRAA